MLSHLPCWCVVLQITQVAGEYDLDPEKGRTIANINYFYVLDLHNLNVGNTGKEHARG